MPGKRDPNNYSSEHQPNHSGQDRNNNYRNSYGSAENQTSHYENQFNEELKTLNPEAYEKLNHRENLAEYPKERRDEYIAACVDAFNKVDYQSDKKRRQAADYVAKLTFEPMHRTLEEIEHRIALDPDAAAKLKEQEAAGNVVGYSLYQDDSGRQMVHATMKDQAAAEKLAEGSGGTIAGKDFNLTQAEREFAKALNDSRNDDKTAKERLKSIIEQSAQYLAERRDFWQQAEKAEHSSRSLPTEPETEDLTGKPANAEEHILQDDLSLLESGLESAEAVSFRIAGMHENANRHITDTWKDIRREKEKELTEESELQKFRDEIAVAEREFSGRIAANDGFIKDGAILESPTGKGYQEHQDYLNRMQEKLDSPEGKALPEHQLQTAGLLLSQAQEEFAGIKKPGILRQEKTEQYESLDRKIEALQYLTRPEDNLYWKLQDGSAPDAVNQYAKTFTEATSAQIGMVAYLQKKAESESLSDTEQAKLDLTDRQQEILAAEIGKLAEKTHLSFAEWRSEKTALEEQAADFINDLAGETPVIQYRSDEEKTEILNLYQDTWNGSLDSADLTGRLQEMTDNNQISEYAMRQLEQSIDEQNESQLEYLLNPALRDGYARDYDLARQIKESGNEQRELFIEAKKLLGFKDPYSESMNDDNMHDAATENRNAWTSYVSAYAITQQEIGSLNDAGTYETAETIYHTRQNIAEFMERMEQNRGYITIDQNDDAQQSAYANIRSELENPFREIDWEQIQAELKTLHEAGAIGSLPWQIAEKELETNRYQDPNARLDPDVELRKIDRMKYLTQAMDPESLRT